MSKKKLGRPPMASGIKRTMVSLDMETAERIKALGIGNLSAWIRAQIAKAWTRRK